MAFGKKVSRSLVTDYNELVADDVYTKNIETITELRFNEFSFREFSSRPLSEFTQLEAQCILA